MKLAAIPETSRAILPSEGYADRRPTRHIYLFSRAEGIGTKDYGMGHYYRCSETGAVRRWGFDEYSN